VPAESCPENPLKTNIVFLMVRVKRTKWFYVVEYPTAKKGEAQEGCPERF
jgi:hypothetical protein